ncbi:hypothetical protein [Umezawaea beigongshangensis]|uniref:hypothetical protein n=1 Tax=Umezawaea beigongshangensis TaxID=2780383 RepID=UPI0018F1DCEA|nr:hypothetical protein [Umezawaea beigongshangensis]
MPVPPHDEATHARITDDGSPLLDISEAVEQTAQLSAFERVGKAADIACAVAFIASDQSHWISGSFIDAAGEALLG